MSVDNFSHLSGEDLVCAQTIQIIAQKFDLAKDEEIFDDFNCSLRTAAATNAVTDIIGTRIGGLIEHMGHIYLTDEHICFLGHMLGETKFKLRFVDVTSIVKSKTLGIIDWAIMVRVRPVGEDAEQSYLFGAFENRDLAYKRMMDLWATQVPEAKEAKLWQQTIRMSYEFSEKNIKPRKVSKDTFYFASSSSLDDEFKSLEKKREPCTKFAISDCESDTQIVSRNIKSRDQVSEIKANDDTMELNTPTTIFSPDGGRNFNSQPCDSKSDLFESKQSIQIQEEAVDDHDYAEEITEKAQSDKDLNKILEEGKGKDWKQHLEILLDLSVEQFWTEFLDDNAKFGLDKLQELQKFWDVKYEPWKNSKRTMSLIAPVVNVPFINQTKVTRKVTQIHKSESKIIIDIESKAHDAPYGDTFVCKEMWALFGSDKDPKYPQLQLKQFYYVKFLKYTMFKSQIAPRTEEGILQGLKKWKEHAEENGHFEKKEAQISSRPTKSPSSQEIGQNTNKEKADKLKASPRGVATATTDSDEKDEIKFSEQKPVQILDQDKIDDDVTKSASKKPTVFAQDALKIDRQFKLNQSTVIPIVFLLIFVLMLTLQSISSSRRNSQMQLLIDSMIQNQNALESQLQSMNAKMDHMKQVQSQDQDIGEIEDTLVKSDFKSINSESSFKNAI